MAVVEYKVSVKRFNWVEYLQHFLHLQLRILDNQADPLDLKHGSNPRIQTPKLGTMRYNRIIQDEYNSLVRNYAMSRNTEVI